MMSLKVFTSGHERLRGTPVGKEVIEICEKEVIRRYLLATMLCSSNPGKLKGSHSNWVSF